MFKDAELGLLLLVVVAVAVARWWWRRSKIEKTRLTTERDVAVRQAEITANALQELQAKQEAGRQNSISRSENQINAICDPDVSFYPKPVMNRGEYQVYVAAKLALKDLGRLEWHIFPQVSLGEVIKTSSHYEWKGNRAHQSINSKRCDLLITDGRGKPRTVIEFQGSGHYQSNAVERDLVKKIAVERAEMNYVEIPDRMSRAEMVKVIVEALR
jgi:hypothetical protein